MWIFRFLHWEKFGTNTTIIISVTDLQHSNCGNISSFLDIFYWRLLIENGPRLHELSIWLHPFCIFRKSDRFTSKWVLELRPFSLMYFDVIHWMFNDDYFFIVDESTSRLKMIPWNQNTQENVVYNWSSQ